MPVLERPRSTFDFWTAAASALALDVLSTAAQGKKEVRQYETADLTKEVDRMVFDWDGVLFDSTKRLNRATLVLIQERGDPKQARTLTDKYVEETFDMPVYDYLRKYGVKVDGENEEETSAIRAELYDYYHNVLLTRVYDDIPAEDEMFPETVGTIKSLHEQGIKLDIISAGNEEKIRTTLTKHGISDCFDTITGNVRSKSQAIAEVAEGSEDPSRIVYFGDLPSDIRDTKKSNSGVRSVAVARNEAAVNRMQDQDSDFLVTGLTMDNLKTARKYKNAIS